MESSGITRIGFIDDVFEVVVYTDDLACGVPHVHVVDRDTHGDYFNCSISLKRPKYYKSNVLDHKKYLSTLNNELKEKFNNFILASCKNHRFKNNYDYAVSMWNDNNSDSYIQLIEDENGRVVVPDYTKLPSL